MEEKPPEIIAPIEGKILFLFFQKKKKKKIGMKAGPVFEQKPNLLAPKKPPRQNSANFATPP